MRDIFDFSVKYSLAYRNLFDTDYKIWEIEFNVPVIGRYINNWLASHNKSAIRFKEDSKWKNRVSYVRRWYRKR